jgi:hypothetical protein
MNILKLQDQLKGLPDNALITHVQNPTGQVPTYLALAELQRRKEMRNSYQANKPEEKTVADDLVAEATQPPPPPPPPGLAGLPQAQPMMEAMASPPEMPVQQMAQGGLADLDVGDMFNEQNYAQGGIVAFDEGGEVDHYAQGGEVQHYAEGGPSQATLKYQAALADSYLDPRYLVSGAQDLVSRNLFGYRVVRDPVTGELIQAKDLPSATDALRKKKKSEVEELLEKAEKVKEERKSEVAKKENIKELDPTTAATMFNRDALYKDPDMAELYNMTKPRIPALPEKSKVPPNATQQFNPYATVEKPRSTVNTAEDTARRFQEMMGADPEREDLRKKVQELELGSKEQERMAPWLSLARAGFGMAAGKSPFALQNVGEGAQLGISEYVAARDRLDKLNERRIDIRSRLNQVERGEKAAGVSAGLTKELKQMEEDNANARNAATNQVQLKTAAIAAAKKSDYETYLSIAQQDPDNYKLVKNPETGESTKVFDAPKVTQAYKSFSGSSGLDDDKLLPLWQQEKMMDKNFKMSFQEYANMMRSKLGGTTQSATPTKTLNNIFK